MRVYRFHSFGLENLKLEDVAPPTPGPGEVVLDVKALSVNYRDNPDKYPANRRDINPLYAMG